MKRVEQGVPLKTLDLRMCGRGPYNIEAVQSLSDFAIDILRPLDFLGPEDTEESRDAGLFMLATMLTMWEPFLPFPCYSGDDDSEYEEDGDEDDEDDEDDDDEDGDSDNEDDDGGGDDDDDNDNDDEDGDSDDDGNDDDDDDDDEDGDYNESDDN